MKSRGVKFQPSYGRQAFKVDGKYRFWGGSVRRDLGRWRRVSSNSRPRRPKANGIDILYETRGLSLIYDDEKVTGLKVKHKGKVRDINVKAVVLASGGFEANPEMRYALPRSGLGVGQGARHPLSTPAQWHPDGARHRRDAARQLVRLPTRSAGI